MNGQGTHSGPESRVYHRMEPRGVEAVRSNFGKVRTGEIAEIELVVEGRPACQRGTSAGRAPVVGDLEVVEFREALAKSEP